MQDAAFLQRLRLTLGRTTEESFPGMHQEQALVELVTDFSCEVAGRYAWAHVPFSLNMPQCFAVFLLEDELLRAEAVAYLEKMLMPLYQAECCWKQATDKKKTAALAQVFNHIGFCHQQLPRELLACLLQSRRKTYGAESWQQSFSEEAVRPSTVLKMCLHISRAWWPDPPRTKK